MLITIEVSMNTTINWVKNIVSLVVVRIILALKTFILGLLTILLVTQVAEASENDIKTKELIKMVLEEMKQASPNTEITDEMLQSELHKRNNEEKLIIEKEHREQSALQHKLRADEKIIMEKAINSNNTAYMEEVLMKKYNVSQKEAIEMIRNGDERAYLVLREVIVNSKSAD